MTGVSLRPWTVGLVIALLITMALTGHALWPHHLDHRPITLPQTLHGFSRAPTAYDFGIQPSWHDSVDKSIGGAELAGRAYRPAIRGQRPLQVNLSVARTDLTGKLDEHLTRKPHTQIGDVTCSQTFDFAAGLRSKGVPDTGPHYDAGKVVCWRNSADLSVVVFALYTPDDYRDTVAQMVDEAWAEVRSKTA